MSFERWLGYEGCNFINGSICWRISRWINKDHLALLLLGLWQSRNTFGGKTTQGRQEGKGQDTSPKDHPPRELLPGCFVPSPGGLIPGFLQCAILLRNHPHPASRLQGLLVPSRNTVCSCQFHIALLLWSQLNRLYFLVKCSFVCTRIQTVLLICLY